MIYRPSRSATSEHNVSRDYNNFHLVEPGHTVSAVAEVYLTNGRGNLIIKCASISQNYVRIVTDI